MPVSNRLCMERYQNRLLDLHYKKLSEMKPTPKRCQTVDNTLPDSVNLTHLKFNGKKMQQMKERAVAVEQENKALLGKLMKIQSREIQTLRCPIGGNHAADFPYRSSMQVKPGMRLDTSQYPIVDCASRPLIRKSLNEHARLQQLDRVAQQNVRMLTRLQLQTPAISAQGLENEFQQNQRYLSMIRNREVQHLGKSLSRKAWTRSGTNTPNVTPRGVTHTAGRPGTDRPWTVPEDMPKDPTSDASDIQKEVSLPNL